MSQRHEKSRSEHALSRLGIEIRVPFHLIHITVQHREVSIPPLAVLLTPGTLGKYWNSNLKLQMIISDKTFGIINLIGFAWLKSFKFFKAAFSSSILHSQSCANEELYFVMLSFEGVVLTACTEIVVIMSQKMLAPEIFSLRHPLPISQLSNVNASQL